jgi:hypothetical protein
MSDLVEGVTEGGVDTDAAGLEADEAPPVVSVFCKLD